MLPTDGLVTPERGESQLSDCPFLRSNVNKTPEGQERPEAGTLGMRRGANWLAPYGGHMAFFYCQKLLDNGVIGHFWFMASIIWISRVLDREGNNKRV